MRAVWLVLCALACTGEDAKDDTDIDIPVVDSPVDTDDTVDTDETMDTDDTDETMDTDEPMDTGDTDDSGDTDPPVVDVDGDGSPEGVDCDDNDPLRFPDSPEWCDLVDNDCDPLNDRTCECADGSSLLIEVAGVSNNTAISPLRVRTTAGWQDVTCASDATGLSASDWAAVEGISFDVPCATTSFDGWFRNVFSGIVERRSGPLTWRSANGDIALQANAVEMLPEMATPDLNMACVVQRQFDLSLSEVAPVP